MKIKSFILLLVLAVPMFGQTVVDEAKVKLAKEKHAAQVEQAKDLLARKEALQAELDKIDADLAKLANGQDVKLSAPTPQYLQFTGSTNLGLVSAYPTN